jgi:hypothetical protein
MVALGARSRAVTPTLFGRWQTRLALLATIGILITLIFTLIFGGTGFFFVLLYVAIFGVIWDVIYIALQQLRWDRDWPAVFQVINGLTEGVFLYLVIRIIGLPGVPKDLALGLFIAHYGLVWLSIFLWTQGPMRALFPFWRFHGGVIVPRVPRER